MSIVLNNVLRFDSNPASSVVRTDEGYLSIDAPIGAVGVVTYRDPVTGKTHSEFRPPEELFRQDSIDSVKMKPITDDHPVKVGGLLTPASVSKFSIGNVGENVRQDGDLLMAHFTVQNGTAIKKIESGKKEISPGYTCNLDATPGEWNGQKYDYVQREIKYNHVAVVNRARGGRQLSIHMDGDENFTQEETVMPGKVKLDSGIEYEVPQEVKVAFDAVSVKLDSVTESLAAVQKDCDSVKADRDALKVRLDEAESRDISGEIGARVALAAQVQAIVGATVKLDSFDPDVLKRAAIGSRFPTLKLDGKSADYVNAMFDTVVNLDAEEKVAASKEANGRAAGSGVRLDAMGPEDTDPRAKMIAEGYNGVAKSKNTKIDKTDKECK